MFIWYDGLLFIYGVLYLPYLLLTGRWYAGFETRLGFFLPSLATQIRSKKNIWIHAVSVGEVMVMEGVIDRLRLQYPAYQIIASVTTKTGYALARSRLKDKAVVIPSPLDFSWVVAHFIDVIAPAMYIALETEIWPHLYRSLSKRRIPLAVINGRISENSFGRYWLIRFWLKDILNQVSVWCMQSPEDFKRITALGAKLERVLITGNIKFDLPLGVLEPKASVALESQKESWWVAGSTHPGEEEILLDVYSKLIAANPHWRLVIAPRHVKRVPAIIALIHRRGMKALKFSAMSSMVSKAQEIIVVDTIGDLRGVYAKASLVFVGKSLCVGGGHNVIEPASYGKAIIVGPRVANFKDIVACFKAHAAIVQVQDTLGFESAVKELCEDSLKREALGRAATHVIALNQGATQRTLESLVQLLPLR